MKGQGKNLVTVVVVTGGKKDYLLRCLESLQKQSCPSLQIVVIDNSLNPQIAKKISDNFSGIEVYSSSINLFYAAALNKGIEFSRGEFVLCLNDDIVLERNFIEEAVKGFWLKEDIGMVTGKILRGDKKTLDSTGLFLSTFRSAKERGYGRRDSGQFQKEGFVFGACGAAGFYRKKMLDQIKEGEEYFDSNLVIFYEDLDLAWRANRFGWKGYYLPKAIAYHIRGGSFRPDSGLNKPFARRYLNDRFHAILIRNRYLVVAKNESVINLILFFIPILIYDICSWLYLILFRPGAIKFFLGKSKFRGKA
jgi:GT2 family glycosyltransferase